MTRDIREFNNHRTRPKQWAWSSPHQWRWKMTVVAPLISRLEESPTTMVTPPTEYDEQLQMAPRDEILASRTVQGTAYVTQGQDYEQDFEVD